MAFKTHGQTPHAPRCLLATKEHNYFSFFGKVTALLDWHSETINTMDGFNEPQKNATLSLIPPVYSTVPQY